MTCHEETFTPAHANGLPCGSEVSELTACTIRVEAGSPLPPPLPWHVCFIQVHTEAECSQGH